MKKTKIICSIGPASVDTNVMTQMVEKGMNVARVNFTHATIEERAEVVKSVREVRKITGKNIALLWDTKGPELRSGVFKNEKVKLEDGKTIRIVKEEVLGNEERFTINHPNILSDLEIGDVILLENAKMRLEVLSTETDGVTCEIISGGVLGNKKSISIPGKKLNIDYVSPTDYEDIKYACLNGGEYLAISFVSCKEDVLEVKKILKEYNREDFQIICKIESDLGIKNLDEILEVSEGIMIARGDLGTEIPSEMLPIVQKEMIQKSRQKGKISIVATEMLETMMENTRPKRAETADIANAVFNGTDAVMLSGETTIGKYPIETVEAMSNICETAENYAKFDYTDTVEEISIPSLIAQSVVKSSDKLEAKVICTATISGNTARIISNLKPNAPILALTPNEKVGRQLALNWGVYPVNLPLCNSTDEVLGESVKIAIETMNLEKGDIFVTTGNFPNNHESRPTNLMKIESVQ